jgi:hypothetical protein
MISGRYNQTLGAIQWSYTIGKLEREFGAN